MRACVHCGRDWSSVCVCVCVCTHADAWLLVLPQEQREAVRLLFSWPLFYFTFIISRCCCCCLASDFFSFSWWFAIMLMHHCYLFTHRPVAKWMQWQCVRFFRSRSSRRSSRLLYAAAAAAANGFPRLRERYFNLVVVLLKHRLRSRKSSLSNAQCISISISSNKEAVRLRMRIISKSRWWNLSLPLYFISIMFYIAFGIGRRVRINNGVVLAPSSASLPFPTNGTWYSHTAELRGIE